MLAVLILAGISAVFSERYVNVLVRERRDDLTRALLVDAASTYNTGRPGWSEVDLRSALDLAARNGNDVAVVDNTGGWQRRRSPIHATPLARSTSRFSCDREQIHLISTRCTRGPHLSGSPSGHVSA